MTITIAPRAEKELRKIPKIDQIAIGAKIRNLVNPEVAGEEKLSGYPKIFRVRVGDYRIVYKKTSTGIYIVLIGHRKDIYDLLKRLF